MVLGLVGVAIIVRPFSGTISPGQLIALCAALGFAISVILVKSLTRDRQASIVIMFWMMAIQSRDRRRAGLVRLAMAIGATSGLGCW